MQDDKHIEDLEYMLKSVRALIKIIQEIWDNCEYHLSSWEENKSSFTFEREIFEEAKVEKKGRHLTITTQQVSNKKDFGSLPAVPEDLSKLLYVDPPESESDILPYYKKYLEKSSILCKELLLPFLTGFKEHLENVQVFVGQIEAWLIEPSDVFSFMKETFIGPGCSIGKDKNDRSKIILYRSNCLDIKSKMESTFDIVTEDGREGLKATLTYIKIYKPVTQIEVKGAGEKAVNGTYTLRGLHDDVYYYTNSGVWDGKPVTIFLNRQKNKKGWCISCKDETQTDSPQVQYFYWTKSTGEEYELPPLNGWGSGGNSFVGIDPPPTLLHKVDV